MSESLEKTAPLAEDPRKAPDAEVTRDLLPVRLPAFGSPHTVLLVFADNSQALQFEVVKQVILGRRAESGQQPDIDLAPFGAFPAGVSRLHAELRREADGVFYLQDLGSTNGTFLDEERLDKGVARLLKNGDFLRLGFLQAWIYFQEA
jgi:hypothetical protein